MLVQRQIVRLDLFIYRSRLCLAFAYLHFPCQKMHQNEHYIQTDRYININKADGYRKTECPTLNLKF